MLGAVAYDERAAGLLAGRPGNPASLRRSALVRSVRGISERVAAIGVNAVGVPATVAPASNAPTHDGNGRGEFPPRLQGAVQ